MLVGSYNITAGDTWSSDFSEAHQAGDWARVNAMVSAVDGQAWELLDMHRYTFNCLDEIVDAMHRLKVVVPANVMAAREAFRSSEIVERTSALPPLSRRAKLIIVGGAAVAAAAYAYHRYRRAAKRADLEAVKSLLAGGDSAASLDAAATPQRRTPQSRPSAKERSKVMERNKKLQAQKRAAETARDAATASAARTRADNERLLASNASVGDERDAARAECDRLRAEVDRLSAQVARRSASADAATVHALRSSLRSVRNENDSVLAAKAALEATVLPLKRDRALYFNGKLRAEAQLRNREAALAQAHDALNAVAAERDRLVTERDALLAERDALEESARLVPAPSAGDLAALPDDALATFAAEAAALSHTLVREDARRAALAATATAPTSECVVCQSSPLQIALGCGHFCACDACARGLSKCPICRAPVTERRRIYAS